MGSIGVSELIPAWFIHSPSNCQESRGAFHRPRCCRCSCIHHSHAAAVVFVYMTLVAADYFNGAEVLGSRKLLCNHVLVTPPASPPKKHSQISHEVKHARISYTTAHMAQISSYGKDDLATCKVKSKAKGDILNKGFNIFHHESKQSKVTMSTWLAASNKGCSSVKYTRHAPASECQKNSSCYLGTASSDNAPLQCRPHQPQLGRSFLIQVDSPEICMPSKRMPYLTRAECHWLFTQGLHRNSSFGRHLVRVKQQLLVFNAMPQACKPIVHHLVSITP